MNKYAALNHTEKSRSCCLQGKHSRRSSRIWQIKGDKKLSSISPPCKVFTVLYSFLLMLKVCSDVKTGETQNREGLEEGGVLIYLKAS